jgi:hypothetical protein
MPPIGCPQCHSTDTARRRRRGILNKIRSTFNSWPYRCLSCGVCFHANQRQPGYDTGPSSRTEPPRAQQAKTSAQQDSDGPRVAYRTEPVRPYAKIVLEADTHEQMDAILMALDRAVSMHRGAGKEHSAKSHRAHV